jgi:hypothetical protein
LASASVFDVASWTARQTDPQEPGTFCSELQRHRNGFGRGIILTFRSGASEAADKTDQQERPVPDVLEPIAHRREDWPQGDSPRRGFPLRFQSPYFGPPRETVLRTYSRVPSASMMKRATSARAIDEGTGPGRPVRCSGRCLQPSSSGSGGRWCSRGRFHGPLAPARPCRRRPLAGAGRRMRARVTRRRVGCPRHRTNFGR